MHWIKINDGLPPTDESSDLYKTSQTSIRVLVYSNGYLQFAKYRGDIKENENYSHLDLISFGEYCQKNSGNVAELLRIFNHLKK